METLYILELCDTSGEHKPIARFNSSTPFIAVNIGDRFDDTGWDRLDGVGVIASSQLPKRYIVHSIKHLILSDSDKLIIKYCLNLQPFTGPSSPVWG
ncbi:hypothetical protein [Methylomonas sp. AM2-LC]|uniref:hypothetical protein n=1 Tax=Methylomonas sp. AM2-LC TaxID=3153301 RepID=UPI003265B2E7